MNLFSTSIALAISVATLFVYILIGFVLKKTKIAQNNFTKELSIFTIYVAQIGMFIHSFLRAYEQEVLLNLLYVFLFAIITHTAFYLIATRLFRGQPDKLRRSLQFSMMFSNVGFMGIPVIRDTLGEEFVIYATAYIAVFNIFQYSLGRLIYTDDKKFISPKKLVFNPAVIPICIGFILFITGIGGAMATASTRTGILDKILAIFYTVAETLHKAVVPVSMVVIGARLANLDFKTAFKDIKLYLVVAMRGFVLPLLVIILSIPLRLFNIVDANVLAVVVILSSTPTAATTSIFAELYDGDPNYAGKLVATSTLFSIITMPIMAFVMTYIYSLLG